LNKNVAEVGPCSTEVRPGAPPLKKYQQRNKKHRHATDLEDFGEASSTQVPRFGAKQAQCSLFLAIKMSSEIDKYIYITSFSVAFVEEFP
jgi:hypothetical protein